MEENFVLPTDFLYFFNVNGMNHTNFIMNSHDRDQAYVGPDSSPNLVDVDEAVFFHGQVSDLKTLLLQVSA